MATDLEAEAGLRTLRPHVARSVDQIESPLRSLMGLLLAEERNWPLFLYGAVGRGKTCAALCLVDDRRKRGIPAMYCTISELMDARVNGNRFLWDWLRSAPLAVVDEIGRKNARGDKPAAELAYGVVADAAEYREHDPTVWISNHAPEKIAYLYDDPVASRMTRGTHYEVTGDDRRQGFKRRVR